MGKNWTLRYVAIFLAALLAVPATIAAPAQQSRGQAAQQSGQQSGQSGQTTQPPAQQNGGQPAQQNGGQAQTQDGPVAAPDGAPPAQQPTTPAPPQDPKAAQNGGQGPAPVPQSTDPTVKPGGKQDVDAIGNRNVGHGVNFYSLEHEIALGKQLAQEVDRSAKFIDDPVIIEYVNRVGQNLVRNSDAQVPFTIKVIDSDVINAFALPGGFFYVNSGLLLHADEESELAGVMAHEIAHVCARHGTKNATKATMMQLAMIPLIMLGPGGWAGYGIYQAANFLIPVGFLKFSRDAEREADYLGLQYMYKAGYDPNSFVSFFEKVEAQEKKQPGSIPKVFSTHPPTPDRIEAIQKEIATILPAREDYIVTTSEFDVVKRRLQLINNNIKVKDNSPDKPTLRKRTDTQDKTQKAPGDGTASGDGSDDPDRPTLKRRPDQQ
jgi:Zn-dependent protease with chaperone function